jgi:hypothetical protein
MRSREEHAAGDDRRHPRSNNMNGLRAGLLAASLSIAATAHAQVIGPIGGTGLAGEYARASDSPFAAGSFSYFHLETFEDQLFNTPGVSASAGGVTSVIFGPSIHDSVDTDDGALDGSGLAGDDYFSGNGGSGITFSFSAAVLGALPTHAGLVWTDGDGSTSFEAFDHNGVSLGVVTVSLANGSFNGETSEDRFFGAIDPLGISAIKISNSSGGIEIDHVQYGLAAAVPEPETYALMLAGFGLLGAMVRRRVRSR